MEFVLRNRVTIDLMNATYEVVSDEYNDQLITKLILKMIKSEFKNIL